MTTTAIRSYSVHDDAGSPSLRQIAGAVRTARKIAGLSEEAFGLRIAQEMGYDVGTMAALARSVGPSPQTVRDMESGRLCPSTDAFMAIARVAKVSVCSLLEEAPLDVTMLEMRLAKLENSRPR